MIKFLFVSSCLHPSPPRSLPVTLEKRPAETSSLSASPPDCAAAAAPAPAAPPRRRRRHPTEEWSAPGRMGRFARCTTDAWNGCCRWLSGNLRFRRDETLLLLRPVERGEAENDDARERNTRRKTKMEPSPSRRHTHGINYLNSRNLLKRQTIRVIQMKK